MPQLRISHFALVATRFARPLFSWSYKLLFPQTLCFDQHLRCPPGVGVQRFNLAAFSPQNLLTPLFIYCCKLFVVAKKLNLFIIKQIQTLSAKHPGWGMPPLRQLSALCVSALSFASSFLLRQFATDSPCISANSRLNLSGLSTLLAPGTLFTRRRVHGHLGLEGLPHLRTYLDPDSAFFRRARRAHQLEPASRSLPTNTKRTSTSSSTKKN